MLRSDGKVGFVFIRNKTGKMQNANIRVTMPGGSTFNFPVSVDSLGAYFLPVDLPIRDGNLLHYSNVQLSALTEFNGRPLLVAYGFPGEKAIIDWGPKVFTGSITSRDSLYAWNGSYVLLCPRSRASKEVLLNTKNGPAVLLSDSYLTIPNTQEGKPIQLQTRPGADNFSLVITGGVSRILLDGKSIKYGNTPGQNIFRFTLNTPDLPRHEVEYGQIRYKNDDDAEENSYFKSVPNGEDGNYLSLDSLGSHLNGYSVYEGKFDLESSRMLKVDYYADDWHSISIDGKSVKGLTGNSFEDYSMVRLSKGIHNIKIVYENEGRPNSGFMEEKKGLKYIHVLSPEQMRTLKKWKYRKQQTIPPGNTPPEAGTDYNDSGWTSVEIGNGSAGSQDNKQAGTWYRKTINLTSEEAGNNPRFNI